MKKGSFFDRVKPYYIKISLIFLHTFILFVLINVIFYFIPNPIERKNEYYGTLSFTPQELIESDSSLLKNVYGGITITEIKKRLNSPEIKSHPVLRFMNQPIVNECYQLGVENCRYDKYTGSDSVTLSKINGGTWVLGGSTIFGRGVCSNETISYYLNEADSANTYINFGVQGYTQWNEIEKLILLLRKGYRPKRVVFLDGYNDLIAFSRWGFEACEISSRNQHAYTMEWGPDYFKPNFKNIYAVPVLYWLLCYKASKKSDIGLPLTENIYTPDADYNKNGLLHFNQYKTHEHKPGKALNAKIIAYLKGNNDLIENLSKAYGFEYSVFFQPIGVLYKNHKFVKNRVRFEAEAFAVKPVAGLESAIRDSIKSGYFKNYYDISQLHYKYNEPYIDLVHYSPAFNKIIANTVLSSGRK